MNKVRIIGSYIFFFCIISIDNIFISSKSFLSRDLLVSTEARRSAVQCYTVKVVSQHHSGTRIRTQLEHNSKSSVWSLGER